VYVVVVVLLRAGNQLPVIPFVDVDGKVKFSPLHTGGMGVKTGTTGVVLTETVVIAVVAH
jgi:hypothetical protein